MHLRAISLVSPTWILSGYRSTLLLTGEMVRHGRVRSFAQNFGEKYDRVRKFDKRVMIAEFGVDGDPIHQRRWIADALSSLHKFQLLETIVYFNSKDHPGAWEAKYGIPDWTVEPRDLPTIGHLKRSP